jgi:hypothetical protein
MGARRILIALVGLAVGAALVSPAQAGSLAKRKVVGKATAIGGTKDVRVRATSSGRAHRLTAGRELTLGATIVMGPGAGATLRLVRPAGVPKARDLVFIKSAKGAKHTAKLTRQGKRIIVTIAPASRCSAAC